MKKNDEYIDLYLDRLGSCENEAQKRDSFTWLLNQLFPKKSKELLEYATSSESFIKYIKNVEEEKQSGFIDKYYGNLIIEFKKSITKSRKDAENQLKEYVAKHWSNNQEKQPFLCIASDGKNWINYTPLLKSKEVISVEILSNQVELLKNEEFEFSKKEPTQIYRWLDRIFFRENSLAPNGKELSKDFGINSYSYTLMKKDLNLAFDLSKDKPELKMAFENWQNYLQYTYGDIKGNESLFIDHTYLSGFTKILIANILASKNNKTVSVSDISRILKGDYFFDLNIENYVEKDFFYWINFNGTSPTQLKIWERIFHNLKTYNFSKISSDFLKDIYQELIDPENRHDLGEYYTPDWLSEKIVNKSLENFKVGESRIADITCGSGSFLRAIIKYLIKHKKSDNLAIDITKSVIGFEIHPLAFFIAKTNYILALEDLAIDLPKPLRIPIYLSDSLLNGYLDQDDLIEREFFKIKFDDKTVKFPKAEILTDERFDEIIDYADDIVSSIKDTKFDKSKITDLVNSFINKFEFKYEKNRELLKKAVIELAELAFNKYRNKYNSMWSFIIKNNHRPIFFENRFDVIVGNPPWLVFRNVENEDYRKELEYLGLEKYKIAPKSSKLRTHMELATIFLTHGVDYYLKNNGKLFFVLPRSIFSADHHSKLREMNFSLNMRFFEIWDLDQVKPLFNVPSCVVGAKKKTKELEFKDVSGISFSGKLSEQNCNLEKANKFLEGKKVRYKVIKLNKRTAISDKDIGLVGQDEFYIKKFGQGATIVPRNFYFVESDDFDKNKSVLNIKTDSYIAENSKPPYKDVKLEGRVNSRFIFRTLIAENILPFTVINPFYVHLPLQKNNDSWDYISPQKMIENGFRESGKWFKQVEQIYNKLTDREKTFFEWLNYNNKLLKQNPSAKYWVLYCSSGKNVCSSVYFNKSLTWIDSTNFWHIPANGKSEAFYLVGVLNAPKLNELIKPFQAKGLLGPRHIQKKILDVGILRFAKNNKLHLEISQIAQALAKKSEKLAPTITQKSIGKKRSFIRKELSKEFNDLDTIVMGLFKSNN